MLNFKPLRVSGFTPKARTSWDFRIARIVLVSGCLTFGVALLYAHGGGGGGGMGGGGMPSGRSRPPAPRPAEPEEPEAPRDVPNVEIQDVRTTINRGIALANEGKLDEAIPLLEKMAIIAPDSYQTQLALGSAYLTKREYSKAQKALETAERLEPTLASTHFALALLSEKLGKHETAALQWKQFLSHDVDEKARELAEKHLAHETRHVKK